MNDAQPLLVLSTCPDTPSAERIAALLVENRLAACVNIVPAVTSIYRWQGALERETEVLLLIKTTEARWEALQTELTAAHPYEVPELVAMPLTRGAAPYLAWLHRAVKEESSCAG